MEVTVIQLKKIDIDEIGCHLILEAKIEGEFIRLVLDTGASRTVIHSGFFDVELIPEKEKSIGVGSSDLESYQISIALMQIGALNLVEYKVASMDLTNVIESYKKLELEPVHGVLGGDILEKYQATIDYKNHLLTLCLNEPEAS